MRTRLLFCLCLLSLCCRTATETRFADVPLFNCSGLPCVEASFNGQPPIRLFLDFSSYGSYLTLAAARQVRVTNISDAALRKRESAPGFTPLLANVNQWKIGSVVLHDSFTIIDPANSSSLADSPRDTLLPGDGGLSFQAFKDRLIVLDIPHHRLRLSVKPYGKAAPPTGCNRLVEARLGDFAPDIVASKGFAVNNRPITAVIDPLYLGAVIAQEPIEGVVSITRWGAGRNDFHIPGTATAKKYRGDRLLLVGPVFVAFAGHTLCSSAPLVRDDEAFGGMGPEYDSVIGLSVLSRYAFAFDLRNMAMWLDGPAPVAPVKCE